MKPVKDYKQLVINRIKQNVKQNHSLFENDSHFLCIWLAGLFLLFFDLQRKIHCSGLKVIHVIEYQRIPLAQGIYTFMVNALLKRKAIQKKI